MARVVTASSAGTAFEWYDFFIFGSLTPVIAKVFLAGLDPTSALIAALALFAVGFAFRPLGAIIFGAMGDRVGRKATFLTTVSLMGGATFAIGLLPTYAQAGIVAPILLVFLRICQGTALGGEYGGAAIYVAEHADNDKRGAATGWIQSSASFGLLAALLVIFATRTALGEEAFDAWGWRIPFLVSVVLLAISVWMRLKLSESPAFAKLREEGDVSQGAADRGLRPHATASSASLIAFFAIMCAQGAVWYFTFFYMQVFLEKSLGLPAATKDMLLIAMTLVSAPLYVFFGWLSDRVGRKPVMLGGMLLALALYFPGSHLIAAAVNPALVEAQRASPVVVDDRPGDLLGAVRPDRHAPLRQRLRHRQEPARRARHFLSRSRRRPTARPRSRVGTAALAVAGGEALDDAGLKALKTATGDQLEGAAARRRLSRRGRSRRGSTIRCCCSSCSLFVVAATALYGPQAAALVEMFPTRIRYTAMSLPYHVGTGWVGGFLPVTSFAIVAITGDIYAGLWYAVGFTALSAVVTILFLKETARQAARGRAD